MKKIQNSKIKMTIQNSKLNKSKISCEATPKFYILIFKF